MIRSRDPLVLYGSAGRPRGEDMPETITKQELAAAMSAMSWLTPDERARRIFNRVLERRRSDVNPQIDGEEAITVDELTAALRRQGDFTDEFAQELARNVIAHRKPEFEPGDIVLADNGSVFIRQAGGQWKGARFGALYSHLEGPLTKIGVAV
jgi:hypothetical protein